MHTMEHSLWSTHRGGKVPHQQPAPTLQRRLSEGSRRRDKGSVGAQGQAMKPFALGTMLTADAKGEGVAQAEVERPKLAHSSDS